MANNYIYHLTIQTLDKDKSYRDTVSDDAIEILTPFLKKCLTLSDACPLPVDELSSYKLQVLSHDIALVYSVSCDDDLISTNIFAQRSRQSRRAWEIVKFYNEDHELNIEVPDSPWLTTIIDAAGAEKHIDAMEWLADFERCIAWTWATLDKKEINA